VGKKYTLLSSREFRQPSVWFFGPEHQTQRMPTPPPHPGIIGTVAPWLPTSPHLAI
jgi:hypothetical protein